MGQLHILRGVPPNINGKPVDLDRFYRLVDLWHTKGHQFGSWTRNRPRRQVELRGGSVYFVHKKRTLFRMPLICIEPVRDFAHHVEEKYINHVAFVCEAQIIPVNPMTVKYLRGWRYLDSKDAPADTPEFDPIPTEESFL